MKFKCYENVICSDFRKDEVPSSIMDAHIKNVEKSGYGGKFDPYAGLANSGIAGTGPDKEDEDPNKPPVQLPVAPQDEEMKDLTKRDAGNLFKILSKQRSGVILSTYCLNFNFSKYIFLKFIIFSSIFFFVHLYIF